MSLLDEAIAFAATAHADHRRKYDGLPYITHPLHVMSILWEHGVRDEAMLIAAVLHDVVEDTPVGLHEIERAFGSDVASLVDDLTDKFGAGTGGNRRERKERERARIASASLRAQTVKYADFISNTSSITARDPGFARVYLDEKAATLALMSEDVWGLRRSAEVSLRRGQEMLVQHALRGEVTDA